MRRRWRTFTARLSTAALAGMPAGLPDAPHDGGIGTMFAIGAVHVLGLCAIVAMYLWFRRHDRDEGLEDHGGSGGPGGPGGEPGGPGPGTVTVRRPREVRVFVPRGRETAADREDARVLRPVG